MRFSFRTKIYGGVIAIISFAFAALFLYLWYSGEQSLRKLQHEDVREKLALLERLFENELDNQAIKMADWARWDDAYQFVSDRNDAFIVSNMNDESLRLIKIQMMAFVNNSGELVYGKQVYDELPGERSLPDEFLDSFTGKSSLLDFSDLSSVKKGVLVMPETMLLVTAQPITTSDGTGSRRGTLIFARYIDDDYIKTLSGLLGMETSFTPHGFSHGGDVNMRLTRDTPVVEIAQQEARGKLLVDNIFGNPSLVVGVTYAPTILETGRISLGKTAGVMFLGFLLCLGILLIAVEFFLVRRIEEIREVVRQVNTLHAGGIEESDLDDFSYLASVMKGAIEKVQESNDLADVTWDEVAKFRLALDQGFDHVIITDGEGVILYANAAAEKMTGFNRVEMQGKTPALWGRQMSREFYADFWDTIRLKKKVFEGTVTNRRKNGETYQANIRVTPVLDDKKRVLYFIGTERPA